MKCVRAAARLFVSLLAILPSENLLAQQVRRAQPPDEPPVARAVPADDSTPAPRPRRSSSPAAEPSASQPQSEAPPAEPEEPPDKRQLEYANALFARKLYDLAAPEYEKYLGEYPGTSGRAGAAFHLGECYHALKKENAARTAFQTVVNDYDESDFAGPAAYRLAEAAFTNKEYASAVGYFRKASAKSKEPALALSAKYFEARCLESLDKKDDALNAYQQVLEAKGANPYREDSRLAAATLALARGRKPDALRNLEALASETQKPALKAEATVRAGIVAADLTQPERGKIDKGMSDKALALLQKGRALPEAGKWRAIAEIGLLRLEYQTNQFDKVVAEYNRGKDAIAEDARAEMMLIVGNSERQLGHVQQADDMYREIVEKYPGREESKDAQYQRLINFYNADSPDLIQEIDSFLQTNPTAERAEQAKLLKAEDFYRKQQFAESAPIYAELRDSQLTPRLRAECAYKLGWCYVQQKQQPQIIEAFSYFLATFPDNPQIPSALTQRALAYEETKNFDAALGDLNMLVTKFPKAREREAALQQKALILGEQGNNAAMADAFRQLLKEFPKSPIAAQANYYIGKAAFELKDYKGALTPLDTARRLNKEQYFTLATVRIISSFFYLKDRASLTREIDNFLAADPKARVPADILEWVGIQFYNEKNFPAAERYLALATQNENAGPVKPDTWFYLADTETKLNKFNEAENAYQRYIAVANDPAAKAKALLALGQTKIAAHKPDDAQKIADEIMQLQPEGRVNAEARLLAGDVQIERQHFDDAGKAYMAVALLNDDPSIAGRALQKAAAAYTKAGKKDEADRVTKQLRDKYPNFAGS